MEIKNRVLELSNKDFYNILNNKGNKVLDKLEEELKKNNYSFNDFSEIKLDGSQLRHRKYIELYSEIICEFWNKKDFKLKSDEEIKQMEKSERISYYTQMLRAEKITLNYMRKLEGLIEIR